MNSGIVDVVARAELDAGRWCENPRKNAGKWARCGSLDWASCRYCAGLSTLYVKKIIDDGLNYENHTYYFLTLTAPSFGKVHSFLKGDNTMCVCGEKHNDNALAGVPIDLKHYKYRQQIEFNKNSSELFRYSAQKFARVLGMKSVPWCAVREYQQRGALHFHIIVRVPADVPETKVNKAFIAMRKQHFNGFTWGRSADIQRVNNDASNTVRYLSKLVGYSVKSLGKSANLLSNQQRDFYSRLDDCARQLGYSDRVVNGFGYGGQLFSQSKTWGTKTKRSLKDEAMVWAKENDCSDNTKQLAYDAIDARWREIMAELGSREDFQVNETYVKDLMSFINNTPL